MSLWRQIAGGLGVLTDRHRADRDLDDERLHFVDEAAAAYEAQGMRPGDARRRAEREVGSTIAVRERVRDAGWESVVTGVATDVRFAGRMLRKNPVFTAVVVLVVALGSGAVSTVFSAMNAILLRPIAGIGAPDRLVTLLPARRDGSRVEQGAYDAYRYLRDRTTSLDGMAAWGRVGLTISVDGPGMPVLANLVSANYFDVLAARPAAGRFFVADEDRTPATHPVLVVSHAFWRGALGGDSTLIGRTVFVNGIPFTLVGVAPPGFHGLYTGIRVDAWAPLMMQPVLRPRSNLREASWLWMFGRLRDGMSMQAAQAELSAAMAARAADLGLASQPNALAAMHAAPFTGLPGGESRGIFRFLAMLLAASGLLLAIAGVNVAAVLSARYATRRREMAVRAALGAGRLRLLRQLIVEILLLFAAGAIGGFAVAHLATGTFERIPLPANIPLSIEISPDLRVLAVAIAVAMSSGLLFGLAPALQAARRDITARLRDGSDGSGIRRTVFSRTLIVGQLSMSLVLLVVAGLFYRALHQGAQVDRGFDQSSVVTATFEPETWGYDEEKARAFYAAVRERVSALPGVTHVSYTGRLPLSLGSSVDEVTIGAGRIALHYTTIDVGYFELLRIPISAGRPIVAADNRQAAPVALVNETFARRIAADGGAIGRTFSFRGRTTTVVGIARDAKYASLDEPTPPFAYFPAGQVWHPTRALLVRTQVPSDQVTTQVRQAVAAIDPRLPEARLSTLEAITAFALFPQRTAALVTGALGLIGLLLSSIGLYGVMSFSASRRTREIGIRVALGAERATVLRLLLGEGMRLAAIGIVLGLLLSAAVTRLLASWLFGVSPLDPIAFGLISAAFVIVAFVATYIPARRSAMADPVQALRN